MKLRTWLRHENLTDELFARRIGYSVPAVRAWCQGARRPAMRAMQAIVDATGGQVQPNDFFDVTLVGTDTGGEGQATAPGPIAVGNDLSTAGTLEESYHPHNRESQAETSDLAGDRPGDPAAVAAILDQLGGDAAVAEGARVSIVALEGMREEGRVWSQYQRPLAAFARAQGYEMDPVALALRPLGRDFARSA